MTTHACMRAALPLLALACLPLAQAFGLHGNGLKNGGSTFLADVYCARGQICPGGVKCPNCANPHRCACPAATHGIHTHRTNYTCTDTPSSTDPASKITRACAMSSNWGGEFTPSACDESCAIQYVSWWRHCSRTRTVVTIDARTNHAYSKFYKLCKKTYDAHVVHSKTSAPTSMKTNAPVATKTWQLAMTIDGNDMASWGYNSKNWISTRTFNDRANSSKSSYFNAPASQIKLVMSGGLSKSITITPTGRVRSLHQIFNGAFSATHTIKSQWLLVDGAVASQNSCNRQGFNLIVAAGNKAEERRARLGLIMNQENDCDTPDTSIGIGFSDTGNGKVVAGATCDCCAEKGLCKNVGTVAHVYVKPISAQAVSKCVLSACTENGHADNDCCGKTGVTGCKPGYRHSLVQFPVNKAPNGFYQHCNVARAGYTGSTCCQPFTADVCVTTLCSDADLKGNCCSVKGTVNDFYKKTPECAAVGNDRVSSVHLTKGCEVTLCQNDCGNGPQWTFAGPKTINAKGPGSFANDQISSLIVAQMEPPSQN